MTYAITDTKIYKIDTKLLQQLKSGFKKKQLTGININ